MDPKNFVIAQLGVALILMVALGAFPPNSHPIFSYLINSMVGLGGLTALVIAKIT